MNDFTIYLTFDIDQDFDPNSVDYYNRASAKFDSFSENFQTIINILEGKPFSIFLRADRQIKAVHGAYDYLIERNRKLITAIQQYNGEINWHIHIYDQKGDDWVQARKEDNIVNTFNSDLSEVKKIPEINHRITRIGECVMNNALMDAMNKGGVKIDSTALPERKRNDKEKFFDWETTSNRIYNPSLNDYRTSGPANFSLLEVPMTSIAMKAPYDQEPIKRYFNLSFHSDILFQNFDAYVKEFDHLVTITHPFEILGKGQHQLLSYNLDVFQNNLLLLSEKVRAEGKNPVFAKIGDLL